MNKRENERLENAETPTIREAPASRVSPSIWRKSNFEMKLEVYDSCDVLCNAISSKRLML